VIGGMKVELLQTRMSNTGR